MSLLERFSSFVGIVLIGLAAYVVADDRRRLERQKAGAPSVDALGDQLRRAWTGR